MRSKWLVRVLTAFVAVALLALAYPAYFVMKSAIVGMDVVTAREIIFPADAQESTAVKKWSSHRDLDVCLFSAPPTEFLDLLKSELATVSDAAGVRGTIRRFKECATSFDAVVFVWSNSDEEYKNNNKTFEVAQSIKEEYLAPCYYKIRDERGVIFQGVMSIKAGSPALVRTCIGRTLLAVYGLRGSPSIATWPVLATATNPIYDVCSSCPAEIGRSDIRALQLLYQRDLPHRETMKEFLESLQSDVGETNGAGMDNNPPQSQSE